jgi:putative membrane protein
MGVLVSILISGLIVLVVAYLIPGVVIPSFMTALGVAFVLGLLNAIVRPLLVFLTLPINILTFGLFTLVINVIIVYLAAAIVPGFRVENFLSALLFSVLVSVISSLIQA